jgi:hypothetical protein
VRPIEFYLERVRAFPGRPVLVWGVAEVDDHSSAWDLFVVFEQLPGEPPWDRYGFQYADAVIGQHPVSVDEVDGRRFAQLFIAEPPGDIFDGGGCFRIEDPPGYERDFYGTDRAALEDLGRRLADALSVPLALEPTYGASVPWYELPEARTLFPGTMPVH